MVARATTATRQPQNFAELRDTVTTVARRSPVYRTPFTGATIHSMPSNTRLMLQTAMLGLRMSLESMSPDALRPNNPEARSLSVSLDYDLVNFPSSRSAGLTSLLVNHRRRR